MDFPVRLLCSTTCLSRPHDAMKLNIYAMR